MARPGVMRWLWIFLGFLFLALGMLGWLLPIIPGWALVVPGLLILSREFAWARNLLQWLKDRLPARWRKEE